MTSTSPPPDYTGTGLVNLIAEIEGRLTNQAAPSPPLAEPGLLPATPGYVLVVFDGLGSNQLDHPQALELSESRVADLDAPFPSTTTVSLATIATGLTPAAHGLIGYQLHLPEIDIVANTIKWTTLWGEDFDFDHGALLPETTWERFSSKGIETVVVQPANFTDSPLSRAIYRGARFEGVETTEEWVEATIALSQPNRLVMAYLPHIDIAAHMTGQDSVEYSDSMKMASTMWSQLAARLDSGITLVGTADHGHVDIDADRQIQLPSSDHKGRVLYGDSRAMFIKGPPPETDLPATYRPFDQVQDLWGSGVVRNPERMPDGVLFADPGYAILHKFSDKRMIGHHGGLTVAERKIPLLVGPA